MKSGHFGGKIWDLPWSYSWYCVVIFFTSFQFFLCWDWIIEYLVTSDSIDIKFEPLHWKKGKMLRFFMISVLLVVIFLRSLLLGIISNAILLYLLIYRNMLCNSIRFKSLRWIKSYLWNSHYCVDIWRMCPETK